ncbi:Ltp family lipoprotein [Secundilactobacillus kimchicus]|nr:Ltp family lipoprotein [Secundilactobacillus kimchicus]
MLTLKTSYGDAIDSKLAQYAVNHIKVDWNQNALAKAKDYQQIQNLSESRLKMQLTAKAGDQFTEEQANYAIQHLND